MVRPSQGRQDTGGSPRHPPVRPRPSWSAPDAPGARVLPPGPSTSPATGPSVVQPSRQNIYFRHDRARGGRAHGPALAGPPRGSPPAPPLAEGLKQTVSAIPSRPHPFDPWQFHVLLNSLFKVLFNFPSRYLFAIGLVVIFSLRWSLPPALGCTSKQPDSTERSFLHVSVPLAGSAPHGPVTLPGYGPLSSVT